MSQAPKLCPRAPARAKPSSFPFFSQSSSLHFGMLQSLVIFTVGFIVVSVAESSCGNLPPSLTEMFGMDEAVIIAKFCNNYIVPSPAPTAPPRSKMKVLGILGILGESILQSNGIHRRLFWTQCTKATAA